MTVLPDEIYLSIISFLAVNRGSKRFRKSVKMLKQFRLVSSRFCALTTPVLLAHATVNWDARVDKTSTSFNLDYLHTMRRLDLGQDACTQQAREHLCFCEIATILGLCPHLQDLAVPLECHCISESKESVKSSSSVVKLHIRLSVANKGVVHNLLLLLSCVPNVGDLFLEGKEPLVFSHDALHDAKPVTLKELVHFARVNIAFGRLDIDAIVHVLSPASIRKVHYIMSDTSSFAHSVKTALGNNLHTFVSTKSDLFEGDVRMSDFHELEVETFTLSSTTSYHDLDAIFPFLPPSTHTLAISDCQEGAFDFDVLRSLTDQNHLKLLVMLDERDGANLSKAEKREHKQLKKAFAERGIKVKWEMS